MVLRLANPTKLGTSWATASSSATPSSSRQTVRSITTTPNPSFSFRDLVSRRAPEKKQKPDGTPAKEEKSLTQSLREAATRTLFGNRRETELARLRQGMSAADQRKLDQDNLQARALASVDAEGNPLLEGEDADVTGQRAARVAERMATRQQGRLERKKWNGLQRPEHKYSTAAFKISPKKLQLLADQIRGRPIDYAILQMQFSPKRAAKRIKSTLCLARDHAVAKGMNRSRLVVDEAWVGKDQLLKKAEYKGRMRMGIRKTYFSHMDVVLRLGKTAKEVQGEKVLKARRMARSVATGGVHRTSAVSGVGGQGRAVQGTAWGY